MTEDYENCKIQIFGLRFKMVYMDDVKREYIYTISNYLKVVYIFLRGDHHLDDLHSLALVSSGEDEKQLQWMQIEDPRKSSNLYEREIFVSYVQDAIDRKKKDVDDLNEFIKNF